MRDGNSGETPRTPQPEVGQLPTQTVELHPSASGRAASPVRADDLPPLGFGAESQLTGLITRVEEAFARADRYGPLVAGLFGPWGCGKSLWLAHIESHYRRRLAATADDRTPTIPILFNAWRYEAEEHLIVPLLKTTEQVLREAIRSAPVPTGSAGADGSGIGTPATEGASASAARHGWRTWLAARATNIGVAAIAVASGLKGKLAIPLVGELDVNVKDMLETEDRILKREADRANAEVGTDGVATETSPAEALRDRIRSLDSIYYDFHRFLRQVTGRDDPSTPRLNLLFLVDDLDRCLPEKAVQMLESIKLFLEVPGCCFVIAVDDEIVERGIQHRYRDYRLRTQSGGAEIESLPLSGAEYLEKIVHLPLRIPAPRPEDVRTYLVERYPDLFLDRVESERRSGRGAEDEQTNPSARPTRPAGRPRDRLLRLFERAVPPVPRKLIRAAELLRLRLDVAWRNGADSDRLTHAQVVLLQLLAPDLYRFISQRYPAALARMSEWASAARGDQGDTATDVGESWSIDGEERAIRERIGRAREEGNHGQAWTLERIDLQLVTQIRAVLAQRGGFDPLSLVEADDERTESLVPYLDLRPVEPAGPTIAADAVGAPSASEGVAPSDATAFFSQLFSDSPIAWRNAIESERSALAGRTLDDATFQRLLRQVRHRPAFVTLPWIETLAPHLAPSQLVELYRQSDLLRRLEATALGRDESAGDET